MVHARVVDMAIVAIAHRILYYLAAGVIAAITAGAVDHDAAAAIGMAADVAADGSAEQAAGNRGRARVTVVVANAVPDRPADNRAQQGCLGADTR